MTIEEMKQTPVRYMEVVFNQRKFEVLDEMFAAAILNRVKQNTLPFLLAFPDWHGHVEDVIVSGDRVANRWTGHGTQTQPLMGVPATGKPVSLTGITIFRIAGDKIVEEWTEANLLGVMQQLGVVPGPQ